MSLLTDCEKIELGEVRNRKRNFVLSYSSDYDKYSKLTYGGGP